MRLGFLSSRKNWLCFAKSLYVLFCKIITRARKAWVPGDPTELAARNWLCSAFSCGVELSCAGTLADDIDRSSAPRQAAGLVGNTRVCALQAFLFVELEGELGLFGKITFMFPLPSGRFTLLSKVAP